MWWRSLRRGRGRCNMEKFSFYDLLAVLFPGIAFLYLLDGVRNLFLLFPAYQISDQWIFFTLLATCLGALIYSISFLLTRSLQDYCPWTKMYRSVSTIYLQDEKIHQTLGDELNRRAVCWYQEAIFFSADAFNVFDADKQKRIAELQDAFYDRMYYELDYADKLTVPKSFQSFYLFFRNLFWSTVFSMLLLILLYLVTLLPCFKLAEVSFTSVAMLFALYAIVGLISNRLACWYRERMVLKMYWFFYTHIHVT